MHTPFSKYTLRQAAEMLIENLHICDEEATEIANRISGPRGQAPQCPDPVQVLEDTEALIRAALRYANTAD